MGVWGPALVPVGFKVRELGLETAMSTHAYGAPARPRFGTDINKRLVILEWPVTPSADPWRDDMPTEPPAPSPASRAPHAELLDGANTYQAWGLYP